MMTPEGLFVVLFFAVSLLLAACCIGLASRYDDGRAPPKGARLR